MKLSRYKSINDGLCFDSVLAVLLVLIRGQEVENVFDIGIGLVCHEIYGKSFHVLIRFKLWSKRNRYREIVALRTDYAFIVMTLNHGRYFGLHMYIHI